MIPKETVDHILDTARIDEVVGDFVSLKKRGVNMIGLCPFHNEKTPSFNVNPVRGIYKCFGCGKGGNSVNFVMEHEHLSYPEALRWLAKKYNIEIAEEQRSDEQQARDNERESLFVVSSFAQKFYTQQLHESEAGKAIGLSYFRERGFRPEIIEKFQLGYGGDGWRPLTDAALQNTYKLEYMVKAGLTIQNDENKDKYFDRFRERVIFPVHNASGRVIAFGGRTLKTDKKIAKYINSPETDIYHKSQVLYGLFFAKKKIIEDDVCFLVEGYTDVISMHQAGIENVVASSGTSLTVEQIRLIRRYTSNITILYDGDPAGIKASFRGIDLILEEGMNVRVLLFPDNEDPDSYSKRVSSEELRDFIKSNTKDFIQFKTQQLVAETDGDPIKKAALIRDIVESIALIPDSITRSVYVKECSRIMDVEEQSLLNELNKIRRKNFDKKKEDATKRTEQEFINPNEPIPGIDFIPDVEAKPEDELVPTISIDAQEREIIRLFILYGPPVIAVDSEDEEGKPIQIPVPLAEILIHEIEQDHLTFTVPVYQRVFDEVSNLNKRNTIPDSNYFTHHTDSEMSSLAIDIISIPHVLSDWERHFISIQKEEKMLKKVAQNAIYQYKLRKVELLIVEKQKILRDEKDSDNQMILLKEIKDMLDAKIYFSKMMGRVVVR